jgi:hypothetical protein
LALSVPRNVSRSTLGSLPAARREVADAGFSRFKAMPQTEYLQRALAAAEQRLS